MKNILIVTAACLLLIGCNRTSEETAWNLVKTIRTEGVHPEGIIYSTAGIWLSDPDKDRLVLIDTEGGVIRTMDSLNKPMHLASDGRFIFIPQSGGAQITMTDGLNSGIIPVTEKLDAPSAVSVYQQELGIADQNNHRILLSTDGQTWSSIGSKGKGKGQLLNPVDVHITAENIWIADTGNDRIQAFNKEGNSVIMLGVDNKMNQPKGIFVTETNVFIADTGNDRVLVFDLQGKMLHEITEHIQAPSDVIMIESKLYVINSKSGTVAIFELPELETGSEK